MNTFSVQFAFLLLELECFNSDGSQNAKVQPCILDIIILTNTKSPTSQINSNKTVLFASLNIDLIFEKYLLKKKKKRVYICGRGNGNPRLSLKIK